MTTDIIIRELGILDYQSAWDDMRLFTLRRDALTPDEIWILEHPPVYTLGLNGKTQHILNAHDIPVIKCDRGGQVTYHGPGQLIAYVLLDLQRRHWGVKKLVNQLEQSIINLLAEYTIDAQRTTNAPGVYVNGAKIAALGLRVKNGCSYHGLSFNVDMNLTPFKYINPCGYEGLSSTQLISLYPQTDLNRVKKQLKSHLLKQLSL